MLVLSWHFQAGTMCEYSHDEFANGMLRLRCDSIPKLQQKLPELRRDLQDAQKFKASLSAHICALQPVLMRSIALLSQRDLQDPQ